MSDSRFFHFKGSLQSWKGDESIISSLVMQKSVLVYIVIT